MRPDGSRMSLKALLLDFDGTLADSLGLLRLVYEKFVAEIGGEPSKAEFEEMNGPPLPRVVERLCERHGASGSVSQQLERYVALVEEEFASVRPAPGLDALLAVAEDLGMTVGVVTSNSRRRVQEWLASRDLAHRCEVTVSGEDVTKGKPDPEPYLAALRVLGLAPGEAIVIEDSDSGARASSLAGITTLKLGAAPDAAGGATIISVPSLEAAAAALTSLARVQ